MAKTILFDYTFDASAKTITVTDTYDQKRFLLITNVTTGDIIYNFADSAKGATFEYIYEPTPSTVLTLDFDTTSMSDGDRLQIFYDADYAKIEPSSTFLDPVSKLRVSTPENLIDTDFEYGLQSTKWETLETTANIPTFFSRSGEVSLRITAIDVENESDTVRVETTDLHGLQVGTPIIIVGTTQITCDGGFIVNSVVSDYVFTYRAKEQQSFTGSIKEDNTFLFPAGLYSGTEFKVTGVGAITTDSNLDSELTVNLEYPANFTEGTSFSLSNTFANVSTTFDTSGVNIGSVNTTNTSINANATPASPETRALGPFGCTDWIPQSNTVSAANWNVQYFREGTSDITVDTINNTLTFSSNHGLVTGDAVVYISDPKNTAIGGLIVNRAYYVERVSDTAIKFYSTDYAAGAANQSVISLTSSGTFNSTGKSLIAQGVMISRSRNIRIGGWWGGFRSYYHEVTNNANGENPNRLLNSSRGDGCIHFFPNYTTSTNTNVSDRYVTDDGTDVRASNSANFYYYRASGGVVEERSTALDNTDNSLSSDTDDFFILPINDGDTGNVPTQQYTNTIRIPNHGFSTDDLVSATVEDSGVGSTAYTPIQNGASFSITKVDDNYIKLRDTLGVEVDLSGYPEPDFSFEFTAVSIDVEGDSITVDNETAVVVSEGKKFTYTNSGGTSIGGLTDGVDYYFARVTNNRFNVATSPNYQLSSASIDHFSDVAFGDITSVPSGTSTGDTLLYVTNASVIGGLQNGGIYYARTTSNGISLHPTNSDATNNTNKIPIVKDLFQGNSSTIFRTSIVDLTSAPSPSETHGFGFNAISAADGVYTLSTLAGNKNSFTMQAGFQILPRNLTLTSQDSFVAQFNGFFEEDHGLVTGDIAEVTIDETNGAANITGLTSGNDYYIIADSNEFFRLASSYDNAIAGTAISLTETNETTTTNNGTITIKADTIVGKFSGQGSISFENGQNVITGDGTRFGAYFINGDTIEINKTPLSTISTVNSVNTVNNIIEFTNAHNLVNGDAVVFESTANLPSPLVAHRVYYAKVVNTTDITLHFSERDAESSVSTQVTLTDAGTGTITGKKITGTGSIIEKTIDYVNSNERIEVTEPFTETLDDTYFLLRTRLLLRNDGFALHRPYDGGVELIPSTNPDSQMVRQTRKYFRYQSGKGIQVSFAVNFSPTTQIDSFLYTPDTSVTPTEHVATIKTRYPHRLSEGLYITTSGSTNAYDTIGTQEIEVTVDSNDNIFRFNDSRTTDRQFLRGRTYRFNQSDSSNTGYLLKFSTEEDGGSPENEYTTGVTKVGTPGSTGAYTEITIAANAPTVLYTYTTAGTGYGLSLAIANDPDNNSKILYNDVFEIREIVNPYQFTVTLQSAPTDQKGRGTIEYYVNSWRNSQLKCGLFDDQNGIFFEYDGDELHCCRRSATKQLSGFNTVTFRSGTIRGTDTNYTSQLTVGERITIRGQVYEVTRIDSDTQFNVLPSYRGKSANRVIISKIETTKIPQSQWNIDPADGTGRSGFKLDIHKIQMAYIDYSWYGAGKVRFGFKDQNGDVKYVHSFAHGNYFTEAYMRSGNVPARYEIQNVGQPSYVPALAHWGTSVIMDGRFDPDRAYIFNGNSQTNALTNSSSTNVTADITHTGLYYYRFNNNWVPLGYGIEVEPNAAYNGFVDRDPISGTGLAANTELTLPLIDTGYKQPYQINIRTRTVSGDSNTTDRRDLLLINQAPTSTQSNGTYTIGTVSGNIIPVTKRLPLLSLRLAPSVDNSNTGGLGAREIVNRMQLILNSTTILTTHAVQVDLILNGTLDTNEWSSVNRPSLSEIQLHSNEDNIEGGESVFNFRCQGDTGTTRAQQLTEQDLTGIATLGNSIMGGDNVYPDGPDVLTLVATLIEDPSSVSSATPFVVNARIGWSESQA